MIDDDLVARWAINEILITFFAYLVFKERQFGNLKRFGGANYFSGFKWWWTFIFFLLYFFMIFACNVAIWCIHLNLATSQQILSVGTSNLYCSTWKKRLGTSNLKLGNSNFVWIPQIRSTYKKWAARMLDFVVLRHLHKRGSSWPLASQILSFFLLLAPIPHSPSPYPQF